MSNLNEQPETQIEEFDFMNFELLDSAGYEHFLAYCKEKGIEKPKTYDPAKPNDALDLSQFDYNDLTGESFKKYMCYCELLAPARFGNNVKEQYIFELRRAVPVRKQRYAGMPNSPIDFVGVRLKDVEGENVALATTKTGFHIVHDLNAQITNAHSVAGHGKFYFLKKTK